jgi:hypothetical protein
MPPLPIRGSMRPLFGCFWVADSSFFGVLVFFLMYWFSLPYDQEEAYYLLLMSFE